MGAGGRFTAAVALGLLAAGCATAPGPVETALARRNLARVGLALVPDDEALLPEGERSKMVPCQVLPDCPSPPLPEDPAGYLIVAIDRKPFDDRGSFERIVAAWQPGETLTFRVRRNPYTAPEAGWYEVEVPIRLPGW